MSFLVIFKTDMTILSFGWWGSPFFPLQLPLYY